jgi:hypothetical protein
VSAICAAAPHATSADAVMWLFTSVCNITATTDKPRVVTAILMAVGYFGNLKDVAYRRRTFHTVHLKHALVAARRFAVTKESERTLDALGWMR